MVEVERLEGGAEGVLMIGSQGHRCLKQRKVRRSKREGRKEHRVDNIPGKFNQGNIFFTLPWQHLFLISRKMSSDHYQWAKETKLINIEPKPTTIGGG